MRSPPANIAQAQRPSTRHTEVIRRRRPWRGLEAGEFTTLKWIDWFNHRRPLEPIDNIPPVEAEARHYAQTGAVAMAA